MKIFIATVFDGWMSTAIYKHQQGLHKEKEGRQSGYNMGHLL